MNASDEEPYDSLVEVGIVAAPDGHVRMIVTLQQMHATGTTAVPATAARSS